jgi:hypothetical protein
LKEGGGELGIPLALGQKSEGKGASWKIFKESFFLFSIPIYQFWKISLLKEKASLFKDRA